jgi:hypothetical protein
MLSRRLRIRVFSFLFCLTALAVQASAQNHPQFEAGAARRNITPDTLLPLTGGMGPTKPAKGKQGELMARAMVFRSGNETLAVVGLDLLGFPGVLGDRARALVPRIPADHILIGSVHTHSAPDTYAFPDGNGGHTGSLEYMDFVVKQAAAAINDALDHMQPAELRVASGVAEGRIAYNYYAPDLYDRRVGVLQVRSLADGKTIGTLVNYAIHPEVMGADHGIMSPDLVGPLCDLVESQAGGVAVFMNSAQGGMVTADNRLLDQPRDPVGGYWKDESSWSECERIGKLLASEALRIVNGASWQRDPALVVHSRRVKFQVDSQEMWQVVEYSPLHYPHGADRTVTAQINLVKLGNAEILTIPGEALPNIGFYLKRKMKGEHNFLFGLTNDAFGYILTKVDFMSFPRYEYVSETSLGEMTGEVLIQNALEMVQEMESK